MKIVSPDGRPTRKNLKGQNQAQDQENRIMVGEEFKECVEDRRDDCLDLMFYLRKHWAIVTGVTNKDEAKIEDLVWQEGRRNAYSLLLASFLYCAEGYEFKDYFEELKKRGDLFNPRLQLKEKENKKFAKKVLEAFYFQMFGMDNVERCANFGPNALGYFMKQGYNDCMNDLLDFIQNKNKGG